MTHLTAMAHTQNEYLLIVGLLSCCAASCAAKGTDMNVDVYTPEMRDMVLARLEEFRRLPKYVDDVPEQPAHFTVDGLIKAHVVSADEAIRIAGNEFV